MNGRTHLTLGIASGLWTAYSLQLPLDQAVLITAAAAVGALLPDIDHPNSKISRKARPARLLFMWFRHRGLTHSILGAGIAAWLCHSLLPANFAQAVILAYLSHIWADMATDSGVLLFYPLSYRAVGLPRFLTIRTGGAGEFLVWTIAVVGCLYLGGMIFG